MLVERHLMQEMAGEKRMERWQMFQKPMMIVFDNQCSDNGIEESAEVLEW